MRNGRSAGGEARENRDGVLLGVGGEPLLIVSGRQALTTPLSAGATDSAMRRLVLSACREEGLTVTEYPLTRQMLLRCDEALTVDVQGIVPVLGYRDRRYFNTAAVRLSERINRTDIRTYR
jgi:branched-subunit amino acid aminotransferase/4-amino-4-deoxychorismate lyase